MNKCTCEEPKPESEGMYPRNKNSGIDYEVHCTICGGVLK
jgi:hypothetical protein